MTRLTMHCLAGCALAAAASPIAPGAIAAPHAALQEAPTDGARLAGMLVNEAQILPGLRRSWQAQVEAWPELRAIAAAEPGFVDQVWSRLEPETAAVMARELPLLRQEVGALFHTRLTAAEISAVIAAYETPMGQRVRALTLESTSFPEAERSQRFAAEMRTINANASKADFAAFTAAASGLQKIELANPEMIVAIRTRMTHAIEQAKPAWEAIVQQAVRDYRASHGGGE